MPHRGANLQPSRHGLVGRRLAIKSRWRQPGSVFPNRAAAVRVRRNNPKPKMTREVRGELFFKIKHKDSKNHWASMFFTISTDGTLCGWNSEKEFEKGAFPTEIIDFSPYKLTTTTQTTSVKGNELSGFALEWKDVTFYFVTHESLRQRWVDGNYCFLDLSHLRHPESTESRTPQPDSRRPHQEARAGGCCPRWQGPVCEAPTGHWTTFSLRHYPPV